MPCGPEELDSARGTIDDTHRVERDQAAPRPDFSREEVGPGNRAPMGDGSRDMPTKSASKTITRDPNWLGPAISPGEMLLEEFLKPMGIGQVEAARQLGISLNRLNEIVLGKRGITADTF